MLWIAKVLLLSNYFLAEILYSLGKYHKAIKLAGKILTKIPNHLNALIFKSIV